MACNLADGGGRVEGDLQNPWIGSQRADPELIYLFFQALNYYN
jgi:hypothetical protein